MAVTSGDIRQHRGTSGHIGALPISVVLILLVANLPYAVAFLAGDRVFGGALLAVPDGYSYLAKMQLGASGTWLYTLRFTTDPGSPVSLFTFYILLGHVARLTGIGVLATYHVARLLTSLFFLWTTYHVLGAITANPEERLKRWLLFVAASGLGWLVTPLTGSLSADLWVAESIPFLSLMANPHFPLAWALMLWLMYTALPAWSGPHVPGRLWRVAGLSLVLAEVYSMALPVTLATLGVMALLAWRRDRIWPREPLTTVIVVGFVTAPRLLYTAWIVATHPQLASWNEQNASPSPGLPLALAWGGLLLLLAILGAVWALRSSEARDIDRLWIVWAVIGIAALYVPYLLQRRLSLGLMFPLAMLATLGWQKGLRSLLARRWTPLFRGTLCLTLALSNGLVWLGAFAAANSQDAEIFLAPAEARAIDSLSGDAVVVAAPELGGFIPTRSMARVVYGHAAETPFAESTRADVRDFYAGRTPAIDFIEKYGVTHVIYGQREAAIGPLPALSPDFHLVFDDSGVRVYARSATP